MKCNIKTLFPTLEILKKHLIIDVEKQEIYRISTGHKYNFTLSGRKNCKYYKIPFSLNGETKLLAVHRLFFYSHHGYLPEQIDHIDQDKTNNSIFNLREATNSQNQHNRKKIPLRNGKKTASKHKNVMWCKRKNMWRSRVRLNSILHHIGYYHLEDEAGEAVNQFYFKNNLEEYAYFNDTPEQRERMKKFLPLPKEMQHLKNLFNNLDPIGDIK